MLLTIQSAQSARRDLNILTVCGARPGLPLGGRGCAGLAGMHERRK